MGNDLAGRVRTRAGTTTAPGTDVATTGGPPVPRTIVDHIRAMRDEYAVAMPRGAEADQLIRDAITAVRTTRHLDECDAPSVLGALMTCAQLGLRPGVLGQAWLLPYWNSSRDGQGKGGYQAQLIVGYQGLVALAYRSPQVKTVVGRMVRDGEIFEVDYGVADTLVHKPNFDTASGDVRAYYAMVKTVTGGHVFYVMTRADAEAYRDKYAPRNRNKEVTGPWVKNFDDMALKTCLRQLAKWMPKSTELAQAIEADGGVRLDTAAGALDRGPDIRPGADDVVDGEVVSEQADGAAVPS